MTLTPAQLFFSPDISGLNNSQLSPFASSAIYFPQSGRNYRVRFRFKKKRMRGWNVNRRPLQFIMMRELRTKAVVHESGLGGPAGVRIRSAHSLARGRDRWRRWNLALP